MSEKDNRRFRKGLPAIRKIIIIIIIITPVILEGKKREEKKKKRTKADDNLCKFTRRVCDNHIRYKSVHAFLLEIYEKSTVYCDASEFACPRV